MNRTDSENRKSETPENDEPSKGPSLVLMYSLIALAMVVATAIAALIVLPFYLRR
ncbi:MAG: hypothetical protein ACRD25_08845 [Terracidiphilus sp.]